MPTPTVAPSAASRIALDLTARTGPPGERQVGQHASAAPARRPPASTVGRVVARRRPVGGLHQQPAADLAGLDPAAAGGRLDDQDPQVLLGRAACRQRLVVAGATMTSVNTSATCPAIAAVTGRLAAITPPNADTGSHAWARRARRRCRADRDAARVGVLDDRHRRLGEVVRRPPGRVGVDVVVVGHLLAVQLLGLGRARRGGVDGRAPPAGAGSRRSAAQPPQRQVVPTHARAAGSVAGVGRARCRNHSATATS